MTGAPKMDAVWVCGMRHTLTGRPVGNWRTHHTNGDDGAGMADFFSLLHPSASTSSLGEFSFLGYVNEKDFKIMLNFFSPLRGMAF